MNAHNYIKMRQRSYRFGGQLLLLLSLYILFWPVGTLQAQAIATTVTNTDDSGPGSLREAILASNAAAGPNEILFDLPAGVQTIQLQSALPAITSPVTINALGDQACASMPPTPQVELDGTAAGDGADGFKIQPSASGTRIIGFYINRFSQDGVEISASDSVLACSIIGLDQAGNALGNAEQGVLLTGSNNIVGHFDGFAGNVVSDNINGVFVFQATAIGNIARGNFIGTDSTGTQDRGNDDKGLFVGFDAAGTIIGGIDSVDRNMISGNGGNAIEFFDTSIVLDESAAPFGNQVMGNLIGLDITGNSALPNDGAGISLADASDISIGGTENGAANRIAFNSAVGVVIAGNSAGNKILGNEIFANGGLEIDLGGDGVTNNDSLDVDAGPNGLVNFPESLQATATENSITISGLINAGANGIYIVEFFSNEACDASGEGEGETFLGRQEVITDGNGLAEFSVTLAQSVPVGGGIAATATEDGSAFNGPSSTSEFSACQIVVAGIDPAPVITVTPVVTETATPVVTPIVTPTPPPVTNAAPLAASDSVTTTEGAAVSIDVLANDSDPNDEPLTLIAVGNPADGTTAIVENKVLYTPPQSFNGTVQFFYIVSDGDPQNTRQSDVTVLVEAVNDAPSDILLSVNSIDENTPEDSVIGTLSAVDPDNDSGFVFTLTGEENDNGSFALAEGELILRTTLDFDAKSSFTVGVAVRDSAGDTFSKDLVIAVVDGNNPPSAINLSNARIDENQSAGVTVGTLSAVDPDSPDGHTFTLVDGSGATDNDLFVVDGATLKTAALLDFEAKPTLTVRVSGTDNEGASFEQILTINLNNIPAPPDAVVNTLSFCSGEDIVLIQRDSNRRSRRVLVKIDDVTISDKTENSCQVRGDMTVQANGDTIRNLSFRGKVNSRNQLSSSSIENFTLSVAGVNIQARGVEIEYTRERPSLHITRPKFKMPRELGGASVIIPVPTLIDRSGLKFLGSKQLNLPKIKVKSGLELKLKGRLKSVSDGFEIDADGDLTIPNIGKSRRGCTIGAGATISVDVEGQLARTSRL